MAQPPYRIGILLEHQGAQIGPLVVGIAKRIGEGRSRDIEHRPGLGVELKFGDAVDHERVGRCAEDAVATELPNTSCEWSRAVGINRHLDAKSAKIAAFARPQHQSMRPEADRPVVSVGRPVLDSQRDQRDLQQGGRVGAHISTRSIFRAALSWYKKRMDRIRENTSFSTPSAIA